MISPNSRGYGASDVRIVEAISRFRAGGYDERIGFTVYDTLRYKRAMEELVKEEVEVIMERLGGEVDADRAAAARREGGGAAARPDLRAAHQGARRRAEAAARRARVIRRGAPGGRARHRRGDGGGVRGRPDRVLVLEQAERPARVHHRLVRAGHARALPRARRGLRRRGGRRDRRLLDVVAARRVAVLAARRGAHDPLRDPAARAARADGEHRDEADRAPSPGHGALVPVGARRPPAEPGPRARVEADVRDARALRPRAHARPTSSRRPSAAARCTSATASRRPR